MNRVLGDQPPSRCPAFAGWLGCVVARRGPIAQIRALGGPPRKGVDTRGGGRRTLPEAPGDKGGA
eukprot:8244126-Pyramimonas_sp.AAC.1